MITNDQGTGQLEPDVRVGDGSVPWNTRAEASRLAPSIPKSDLWASDSRGIEQVGCVYTAQGFEFDYVGVIFGPDLVYRTLDGGWVGQRDQSHDRIVRSGVTEQQFTDFVKSTYRVLPTRGLRGDSDRSWVYRRPIAASSARPPTRVAWPRPP